jgi:mRNA deadenylase 3'-5' endonuclease subunit Ccr4
MATTDALLGRVVTNLGSEIQRLQSQNAALQAVVTPARARFSVMSYNVLLPNSVDGWWIYKYYQAGTPFEVTTWPRRQALLRQQILAADSDVVCLQEVSDKSFDSDFAFMAEAGYASVMLSKGRMRNATFWKTAKVG